MVGKIFKIHTIQYIWGNAQVGAGCVRRDTDLQHQLPLPALWGTHPCAQAIIVNDKVTVEVIIVLN